MKNTAKLTSAIVAGILFSSTGFASTLSDTFKNMHWNVSYQNGNTNDGALDSKAITRDGFDSHATVAFCIHKESLGFNASVSPKDQTNYNNYFGFYTYSKIRQQNVMFYGYVTDSKRVLTNSDGSTTVGLSTVAGTAQMDLR